MTTSTAAKPTWLDLVPGHLPSRRLSLSSPAPSFAAALRELDLAPFVRCPWVEADGARYYVDAHAAGLMRPGVNHYGPFFSVCIGAGELEFDTDRPPELCEPELAASMGILERLIALDAPNLRWMAYSFYMDSGEASQLTTGDGAELARRLGLSAREG